MVVDAHYVSQRSQIVILMGAGTAHIAEHAQLEHLLFPEPRERKHAIFAIYTLTN